MELSIKDTAMLDAKNNGYTVNNLGTVFKNGTEVKTYFNKGNYLVFYYYFEKERTRKRAAISVHRFIGYFKFGEKVFDKKLCIRHLDGNKHNNKYENLEIGTARENALDIPSETRLKNAINASSYIKIHNHDKIIEMHKNGNSYTEIMKEVGIKSKGTISFIINKSIQSKI